MCFRKVMSDLKEGCCGWSQGHRRDSLQTQTNGSLLLCQTLHQEDSFRFLNVEFFFNLVVLGLRRGAWDLQSLAVVPGTSCPDEEWHPTPYHPPPRLPCPFRRAES